MRLVLLGCPGAGKGTQAKFITEKYHIPQISTGDILRASVNAGSALGNQIKKIINEGQLVSDDIMIQLIKSRLEEADCMNGFLLDGFPRTIPQAESLKENHIYLNYVIEIKVPDLELIQRLTGRWTHPASGRVYHNLYNPPKIIQKDDVTGEPLVQRTDDQEETVKKRLTIYHQSTEPLVHYYKKMSEAGALHAPQYIEINGSNTVQEVADAIFMALSKKDSENERPIVGPDLLRS